MPKHPKARKPEPLPEVHIGQVGQTLPDWRKANLSKERDDDEMPSAKEIRRVSKLIGFDVRSFDLTERDACQPAPSLLKRATGKSLPAKPPRATAKRPKKKSTLR